MAEERLESLERIPGLLKKLLETGIQGKIILLYNKQSNTTIQYYINDLAAAIIGTDAKNLQDSDPGDFLHPQDDESAKEQLLAKVLKGESVELQLRMTSATKKERVIIAKLELIHENEKQAFVYCLITDITGQKQMIDSLKNSEQNLRDLLDGIPIVIYVMDSVGRIIFANKTGMAVSGYTAEDIGKVNILDILDEPGRQALIETRKEISLGIQPKTKLYRIRTAAGEWIPMEGVSKAVTIGDQQLFLGAAIEISERLKAEDERRRYQEKMVQAQKLEGLGILAGGVAHDFNNILTGILGFFELIAKYNLVAADSKLASYLLQMEESANQARSLAQQMLAYAGGTQFIISTVPLNDLIKEMGLMLTSLVSKKADLKMNFDPALPLILGDLTQLRQVVLNLVTNSSEALGNDPGDITIATRVQELSADYFTGYLPEKLPPGKYAVVEVSDSGCGMDADTVMRMFDPFFSTKFTGRGLGLAAVLGIVKAHKGDINVYSEKGKGTSIKVFFPIIAAATASSAASLSLFEPTDKDYRLIAGKQILVVDDDPVIRQAIHDYFYSFSCQIISAANGEDGFKAYLEHQSQIDLVILDVTMPKMDGKEALIKIKERNPLAKVILISGYAERDVLKNFRKGDVTAFVAKPFDLKHLLAECIKALKSS